MLVWGVLPVWADISVATLHNARENSFLLGCALSRFFGVYTYVVNLYLFLTINLLSVTDHALHHCAHRELVSARSAVERALTEKLKACISLSESLEGRPAGNGSRPSSSGGVIHIQSLTEFPSVLGQPPSPEDKLPESGLVIDLRGYVPLDIHI